MTVPVSRRRVLAGLVAAGAAGALSGVGTAALLRDSETFAATVAAGRVELRVGTGAGAAATDPVDGPVTLSIPALDAGQSGVAHVTFATPDERGVNPAYLWLRGACLGASYLADYLTLTVSYADESGAATTQLFEGSLREFGDHFGAGRPLDPDGVAADAGEQAPVDPGESVSLRVDYALASGYFGSEAVSLVLEGLAVQARGVDATDNPFGDREAGTCGTPACDCCVLVGKLDVEEGGQNGMGDEYLPAGVYSFTAGSSAYRLHVSDPVAGDGGKTVGARFDLRLASDPTVTVDVCSVWLKAGPSYTEYGPTAATDTGGYDVGAADGVLTTADGKGLSHVLVGVCTPTGNDGDCPTDLVDPVGRGSSPRHGGPAEGGETGGDDPGRGGGP
jgi:predicted ribosomally synthesized peptide with SipW-like signal peptide